MFFVENNSIIEQGIIISGDEFPPNHRLLDKAIKMINNEEPTRNQQPLLGVNKHAGGVGI